MIDLGFAKNMRETSNELLGKLKEEVKKVYNNKNYKYNETRYSIKNKDINSYK